MNTEIEAKFLNVNKDNLRERLLPKRSKIQWEIIRLFFLPLSMFSKKLLVNIAGGFKIYYLTFNQ